MLLVGSLLVAAFFALDQTSNTIDVRFIAPWDASSRGELYFWLGAVFFLLPGATLIGLSGSELTGSILTRTAERLTSANRRERLSVLVALTMLAWSIARLGNQLVLRGQPFTDDEGAARFGGQVLASGALSAPLPPMRHAFPELFLFQRDGHWTSFDFIGALLPWTLAEITHTGTLIFSFFACLLPLGVAVACTRREGPAVGLAGAAFTLVSPMALSLSLTSHAHVVSRGLLALCIALLLFVEQPSFRRSLAAGATLGLAFSVRSPEVTMLSLPLIVGACVEARRSHAARARALGLVLGAAPIVVAVLAYNFAVSGSLGFLRSAPNEISVPYAAAMRGPFELHRLWPRFGNNLAYNLLTLSIWFFGPLGLVLAWLGARVSRVHALLGLGVLLDLGLTLLHDDRGLHMVGPVHLSEAAVPLSVLAVAGGRRAYELLALLGVSRVQASAALLGYAFLGLGTFTGWHAGALHQQALRSTTLTQLVEDVPQRPAVVLAPPLGRVQVRLPAFRDVGGFVFEWRRATPDLSEPVLIVHDSLRARGEVEQAFPQRSAYVFAPREQGLKPVPLRQAQGEQLSGAVPKR